MLYMVFCTICLLQFCVNAFAATIRVPNDYPNIHNAIVASNSGDIIIVADGIWTGTYNTNLSFGGRAITLTSQNGANTCIIDCQGTRGFRFVSGESSDSILDGFTIRNGSADKGGGIYCISSSPTIKNCIIKENSASGEVGAQGTTAVSYSYGAGIYIENSSPSILDCTISNNYNHAGAASTNSAIAYAHGGGIYVDMTSRPVISGCIISANIAKAVASAQFGYGWAQAYGGGICSFSEYEMDINNCTINNNSAITFGNYEINSLGGGTFFSGSVGVLVDKCFIDNNEVDCISCASSQNSKINGGGIYCSDSDLVLKNCIVSRNIADPYMSPIAYGGGLYYESSSPNALIINSTISKIRPPIWAGFICQAVQVFKIGSWSLNSAPLW